MKKLKFLSLVLVVLMLLSALSACGSSKISKVASFDKILNKDYVEEVTVLNSASHILALDGYSYEDASDDLALFSKDDALSTFRSYIVYNLKNNEVVGTFTGTETLSYNIYLYPYMPLFVVEATSVVNLTTTETYTIKDAKGTDIVTKNSPIADPTPFADMYMIDYALYSEENGVLTKVQDVPENLALSDCDDYTDEYFYVFDDKQAVVYTREFAPVSYWYAPSYVDDANMSLLNNGNILIQYRLPLEDSEKKYDLYEYTSEGNMLKYDLVSIIFDVKKGTEKEIELDYAVSYVMSYNSIMNNLDGEAVFVEDAFENLAYIAPIVDGQVNTSPEVIDFVTMDNNGKIKKSLKIADAQTAGDFEKIGEDKYLVSTLYGQAVVDAKGELVYPINNSSLRVEGKYIVGDRAIYDLSMNVVYNLYDNNAEVIGILDGVIYIKSVQDMDYRVIALRDSGEVEICMYDADAASITSYIPMGEKCYALFNTTTLAYVYYNANGTELYRCQSLLDVIYDGEDMMILRDISATPTAYYAFVK